MSLLQIRQPGPDGLQFGRRQVFLFTQGEDGNRPGLATMIYRFVDRRSTFEAHRIFMPALLTQLDHEKMVVTARHKPFVTIQRSKQVFRRFANLDAVAGPNFNCLRVLHSQHIARKDWVGVKYAFQDLCDRLRPGVNRVNVNDKLPIQLGRRELNGFRSSRRSITAKHRSSRSGRR